MNKELLLEAVEEHLDGNGCSRVSHSYIHTGPPSDSISLGFDVSAKGEVQPFVKVTATDITDAEILLAQGINILREHGVSMKAGVKEINFGGI